MYKFRTDLLRENASYESDCKICDNLYLGIPLSFEIINKKTCVIQSLRCVVTRANEKMTMLLILTMILMIILAYVYYKHVYVYDKYLKHFPCPPEVPVLGHALDFIKGKESLFVLMDYIKNYGDIVRVKTGPQTQLLLAANHQFFQYVLTSMKILKKSVEYKYFHGWLGTGLITSDGEKWKKHRQIITPTFHYQILEDFVEIFESNGKILVKKFEECLDQTSVNIYDLVNLCTLDIICESAMGTSVHAQESAESDYVQSVRTMCDIIIARVFTPHKMVNWMYYFTEDYKREQKALKVIHSHTWNVINSRQQAKEKNGSTIKEKKRKAFLDLLLEQNVDGEQLSLEEIREEVDTFMFAGHDTTGTSICFSLYCLANHPEEQAKVLSEQRKIFGDDFNRPVTLQDLKQMKYLELVIKESLRLYPSAPFYSRELDEDVEYNGTILPKGLTLTLFVFALHRNSKYFLDPEKFLPSRFENVDGKMPFVFLPFSAGARNCIGQKFAMNEMKSVISRIVRSFELLPAIPHHELELGARTILVSCNGVRIRFKKRS